MIDLPKSLDDVRRILSEAPGPYEEAAQDARARDAVLTKPPGALGRLEELAIWFAGWRKDARPRLRAPQVLVFAGNHGVVTHGVSAFPAEVTEQMVANFATGGAAINQLTTLADATLTVHPIALDRPTRDFTLGAAMDEDEMMEAFAVGWNAVSSDADLLIVGEMGIGNTTSAAAIAHALYGGDPSDWTGRGTGVDEAGLAAKSQVVAEGLRANPAVGDDALQALRCLGGRELAAMAGAIARARIERIPVILDGFICTASAACLEEAAPGALDHAVAGHRSGEAAHAALLDLLGKEPILDLGMRLGEGSGAALAIMILKGAIACHSGMATFGEAGVSDS